MTSVLWKKLKKLICLWSESTAPHEIPLFSNIVFMSVYPLHVGLQTKTDIGHANTTCTCLDAGFWKSKLFVISFCFPSIFSFYFFPNLAEVFMIPLKLVSSVIFSMLLIFTSRSLIHMWNTESSNQILVASASLQSNVVKL